MPKQPEAFVLFETAAGFSLVWVKEWDSLSQSLVTAQESFQDPIKFQQMIQVRAVYLFSTAETALECCKAISSGESNEILRNFLTQNLPSKKKLYQLYVLDPALGKNLASNGFPVLYDKNIIELARLCRLHLTRLFRQFTDEHFVKFQVGLGHNFIRSKLRVDVNRQDKPVQNAVALIENLDKVVNTFSMRSKEWYSWHFPELVKIVPDNLKFAQLAECIGNKDEFPKKRINEIIAIVDGNEEIANEIMTAKDISMGQELTEIDMMHIKHFTRNVIKLSEQRKSLASYLDSKLNLVAPNLQSLLGDVLAAKLIAHAGSLTNLAKYPASTVQILGAEKALFRALKTKSNTPKYGLLFQSAFIGRASTKYKGRVSRYLANKCSLAARVDSFSAIPCDIFGQKMKEQVESRLEYLANGISTRRNIDVMREATELYQNQISKLIKSSLKHEANKRKKFLDEAEVDELPDTKKQRTNKKNEKKEKQQLEEVVQNEKSCQSDNIDDKVVENAAPEEYAFDNEESVKKRKTTRKQKTSNHSDVPSETKIVKKKIKTKKSSSSSKKEVPVGISEDSTANTDNKKKRDKNKKHKNNQ